MLFSNSAQSFKDYGYYEKTALPSTNHIVEPEPQTVERYRRETVSEGECAKPTSNKSITVACNIDSEPLLYPFQCHYVSDTQTQLFFSKQYSTAINRMQIHTGSSD